MRKLMYSREWYDRRVVGAYIYDRRIYGKRELTYKPHLFDIIASRCDISEARGRVRLSADGRYKYIPSEEYILFYEKYGLKKRRKI